MLDAKKKPFAPKRGKPNVIMFVGLQGSGKTTTCTKYAYYWQKKGWRVALVCADTFRAGACRYFILNINIYKKNSRSTQTKCDEGPRTVLRKLLGNWSCGNCRGGCGAVQEGGVISLLSLSLLALFICQKNNAYYKFILRSYEIIIVDTSGRHKQEADLFEEMK